MLLRPLQPLLCTLVHSHGCSMVTPIPTLTILSPPSLSPAGALLGRRNPAHTQLSPCDDLKGRQLLQFLQLLGVLQVLQILAILRGRRRGRGCLFFLGHGGAEAWESEREERRRSGPRPGGRVPSSCQQLNLPGGDRKRIWPSGSVLTRWPTGFITRGPSPRLSRSVFF